MIRDVKSKQKPRLLTLNSSFLVLIRLKRKHVYSSLTEDTKWNIFLNFYTYSIILNKKVFAVESTQLRYLINKPKPNLRMFEKEILLHKRGDEKW